MPTQDRNLCDQHAERLYSIEQRLCILETIIGADSENGIRGSLRRLSEQIAALASAVEALKLTQARVGGAADGARWTWAIVGSIIGTLASLSAFLAFK
jgi:hypothetical protein